MLVRVLFMMLLSVSVVACSSSNKDLGDSEGAVLGGGNVYDGAEGTEIYDGSSVAGVDGSTIPGSQEEARLRVRAAEHGHVLGPPGSERRPHRP